jgi:hypothetical protein
MSAGVCSAVSLIASLLPPSLIAVVAKPVVLLVLAVLDGPAVAVDLAFWPTATIALNLAPLKVRYTLKIKPVVIVVVVNVVREVRMYCHRLIILCLARNIGTSRRVR